MSTSAIPAPSHTLAEAKALAERAIELLIGHAIPPTPLNYAVAHEYFGGTSADLHKALDERLSDGKPLDEFLLRDLYDRHIASDRFRHLRGMGNDLQNILHTLMLDIAEAGEGATSYGQALEQHLSQLHPGSGPEILQTVATDLLSATLEAQSRNQGLQQHLEETRQETESLRAELEQHRREALIDPLTGLFNRRAMDAHLGELMAVDTEKPLSMLMADIDHFKHINDTYGHIIGDVVIRNVAETVRKCIRGEDVAVRYGGEEFLIMLPDTPLDGAVKVAESIRHRIEALRLVRRHDNFTLAPFTISLGVSVRKPDDTSESLIQRADQALYLSKNAGRNRVSHEGLLHCALP